MNSNLVAILAAIAAEQARIAGMQAENQHRLSLGQSIAYGEDAFCICANQLDRLSIEARNS